MKLAVQIQNLLALRFAVLVARVAELQILYVLRIERASLIWKMRVIFADAEPAALKITATENDRLRVVFIVACVPVPTWEDTGDLSKTSEHASQSPESRKLWCGHAPFSPGMCSPLRLSDVTILRNLPKSIHPLSYTFLSVLENL